MTEVMAKPARRLERLKVQQVRRKQQQFRDLSDARACYAAQLRKLGIVLNGFLPNQPLEFYGEGHQSPETEDYECDFETNKQT